jgi:predicted ATPase
MENNLHALKQLILEKTQGTPFFMEEVVQELFEQGVLARDGVGARRAVPLPTDLHIPPTVQGILAARIDRLAPDEKALLQQLAVIGREFPLSLVRQVITQPEADLYRLLASLQHKEFLYEQPAFPEVEYIFKHALTQEVAYGTVLQEQRKLLHERTAQAMETLYAGSLEEHYGDLAHHYRRSANSEKAIAYLQLAGQQAVQRSANAEAVSHFTAARELLKTLPETAERSQQELDLLIALGAPLAFTQGYTTPQVRAVYTRARELCQQMGETAQLFPVLWGLWAVYALQGELRIGREIAEQLYRLAQNIQDPHLLAQAHYVMGATLLWMGEATLTCEHTAQGLTLYDPQQYRSQAFLSYGWDPKVACLSYAGLGLWYLGYPDQALERIQQALTLAHEISHTASLAFALSWTGWIYQLRGEIPAAQKQAEVLLAFSNEQGITFLSESGNMLQSWALAEQGQKEEGIIRLRRGLTAYRASGLEWGRPFWLAWLAEACRKAGQIEEGLGAVAEALAAVENTGECWYEAELYRIKGELLLAQARQQATGTGNREELPIPDP